MTPLDSKYRRQVLLVMGVLPWAVVCMLLACAAGLRGSEIVRPPNIIWVSNEAGTGTAPNKLVKLTGAPSTGITVAAGDKIGAVGVCVSGCGVAAVSATASIANSAVSCTAGAIWADTGYIYVRTAAGTVERAAIAAC